MLNKLKKDKLKAMKDKDLAKVSAINFILTDVSMKQGRLKGGVVTDKAIIKSIESEKDKHTEMLPFLKYDEALTASYNEVINYLDTFIPVVDNLPAEEVSKILGDNGLLSVEPKDVGKSMGLAKKLFAGQDVDMALVSSLVRGV